MPRRATKTSYGAEQGNTPKGTDPSRPGPGAHPQTFINRMALLLERAKTVANVEAILDDKDHPKFDKMLEFAADRALGKVPQKNELTGDISIRVTRDE